MYTIPQELHPAGQETGDGAAHVGDWIPTKEFFDGNLFVGVTAIDADTVLALALEFGTADGTIAGASAVTIANMSAVGQQGPVYVDKLASKLRLKWTITNAKHATFRAVVEGRGGRGR